MHRVAEKVAADFPVCGVAAVHRVGELAIGDLAVVVAVSSAHRAEALACCQELIDEIKRSVPIWKHQYFGDGTDEWVNGT
ncbi:MAG TPA: molybdenum cofactor biosynthesis protein MoaE [Streptosporangiaceae bacterium]